MSRIKGGTVTKRRHKKIRKLAKGYRMTKGRLYKVSKEAVLHAGQYAYNDRRRKKRDFRRLWIQRINAGLTPFKISYSRFINLLKKAKIELNRKILADLVVNDSKAFKAIVDKANAKPTSKS